MCTPNTICALPTICSICVSYGEEDICMSNEEEDTCALQTSLPFVLSVCVYS
jgi:hypothetical protein